MTNNDNVAVAEPLFAHTLPLQGKHLIEASAGTGKTFNITRIYLRMLLERKVSVENILVMTFTKAATEEIRGRIDEFLREALANWQRYTNDPNNEFFYHLGQSVTFEQANILIKNALLNLDEASIFTIHGFCKRVLTQQAFASGMSFSAQMEADDADIMLEAVQDYYRVLAKVAPLEQYQCFVENWSTPESFISAFQYLLRSENQAKTMSEGSLNISLLQLAKASVDSLHANESLIQAELIDNKKGAAKQTRIDEFEQLLSFLKQVMAIDLTQGININELKQDAPDFKFVSAARFPKAAAKAEIKLQLVSACKVVDQFKKLLNDHAKLIGKAQGYELVLTAVENIKISIEQKKQQANIVNFDDLISHLANALQDESLVNDNKNDQPLTNALIAQYPIALIDEFQDTDPKQFAILEQLYFSTAEPHHGADQRALYLIGDPKQAIYGFRGGDIFTYLHASKQVDHQWLMDTNWRSSGSMISGYNHLFFGNDLNEPSRQVFGNSIGYSPVLPSPFSENTSIVDHQPLAALQFMHFNADDEYIGRGGVIKAEFREVIARWCASEISRLLADVNLHEQAKGEDVATTAIQASDVAVLVRDGREANEIKQALSHVGVACVYKSQRSNLFASDIAQEYVHVLNAIINRDDDRAFIAALSGPFFAKSAEQLFDLQQDEMQWEQTRITFNALFGLWQRRGFMAMALKLLHDHYPGAQVDNERQLTNIIHLFELLQTASQRLKQPQELMAFLQEQCLNPAQSEAELRLESDANLVQIVTLHGSKGLEYPVVFVPFATRHKNPTKFGVTTKEVLDYHDEDGQLEVILGKDDDAINAMAAERYAEDVRLLYVAVTRAKLRCYIGCAAFSDYHLSPLGQCLQLAGKQEFKSGLQPLIDAAPTDIGFTDVNGGEFIGHYVATATELEQPDVAQFKGKIERDWWLSSFTALTRNVRHAGKTEPDRDHEQDEQVIAEGKLLRFAFTKGAKTGNFLHDLLQYTDFTQPNWDDQLAKMLHKFGALPSGFKQSDLALWLDEILATDLDGQGLALNTLTFESTLREAEFYFPMQQVQINQLNILLNEFRQSIGVDYIEDKLSSFGSMQGMMHGFIDLIFCHQGRYYVCDYKSSHLGNQFAAYTEAHLTDHVCQNFYDLQFLIYSLALHRYLASRIKDYQPSEHFGGVYYLYLRGMQPSGSASTGVFFQSLSEKILVELDNIFKGQSTKQAANIASSETEPQPDKDNQADAIQGELF